MLQVKLKVRKKPKANKAVRLLTSGRSPGKTVTVSARPQKKLLQQGLPDRCGRSLEYTLAG